jgi:hypothetical protein
VQVRAGGACECVLGGQGCGEATDLQCNSFRVVALFPLLYTSFPQRKGEEGRAAQGGWVVGWVGGYEHMVLLEDHHLLAVQGWVTMRGQGAEG